MLDNFLSSFSQVVDAGMLHYKLVLYIIAGLWAIHLLNVISGLRLSKFGIIPRNAIGLPGIAFSPFLHGSFDHLICNSIPLFLLLFLLLPLGVEKFVIISLLIIGISGLGIWLLGRKAIHIGASSLILGYWGYVLTNAVVHPSSMTIILAILCVFYLGSMFSNIFPSSKKVSWEGHLIGLLSGIAVALIYMPPVLSSVTH